MTSDNENERWEKIKVSFFKYAKIIGLTFIIPLWIVIFINEGIVLWKIINWINLDIEFWTINKFYYWTMLIILIPVVYLFWFYYLTVKRVLLRLHEDLFKKWNLEIGELIANSLIKLNTSNERLMNEFNVDIILMYLNKELSRLPKFIEWIARKVVDKIPFLQFVNSYDVNDLENENKEKLSKSITSKINKFELEFINSLVPNWTYFVIPINMIIIYLYVKI